MEIKKYLQDRGICFDLIEHGDTYDSQRMAESIGVGGRRVAKTVLLRADGGYAYVVAVLPADTHVDLQALSHALGDSQIQLASEMEISDHCPDCECGVLPPFGSEYAMKTLLDFAL